MLTTFKKKILITKDRFMLRWMEKYTFFSFVFNRRFTRLQLT